MMNLPDAPWIREAETFGMPEAETIYCPVCGAENPEEFYTDETKTDVIGCECCMRRVNAYDWLMDRRRRGVA